MASIDSLITRYRFCHRFSFNFGIMFRPWKIRLIISQSVRSQVYASASKMTSILHQTVCIYRIRLSERQYNE